LLLLVCAVAHAQNTEHFTHVIKLTNGKYICGGYTTAGPSDFVVACVSTQGEVVWKKTIGGTREDGGSFNGNREFISKTPDGGFYFAGATASSDGDITSFKGEWDIFVARFDASGNILWKSTFGGDKTEYLAEIEATTDGGAIFAATTASDSTGDVPVNHSDKSDIWVVKLDAQGAIQWSRTYGGSGDDIAGTIKTASDGGYIFTGASASEDGDLTGSTTGAVWVVKLDSAGMITWNERMDR